MREARAVVLTLLVLLGALAVAAPATAGGPTATPGPAAVDAPAGNETAMGDQVSSFMHASSGGTSEEVQSGMWNAAYENAPNRSAVVEERTRDIGSRLDAVEAEKRELVDARENGTIGEAEYRARMSSVVGRMAALNRSIDETERQSRASGVDVSNVERLRTQASNVTGPEVAEVAQSMAGGPPDDTGPPNDTGPPDDTGPPNGTERQGNASGSPGNSSAEGPPGNGPDKDHPGGGSGQTDDGDGDQE